jgi:hypothetical protein
MTAELARKLKTSESLYEVRVLQEAYVANSGR